jgi:hypothetical protein
VAVKPWKLLLGLAVVGVALLVWFALRGSPAEEQRAKDAFVRDLQPACQALISNQILAEPQNLVWQGEPMVGHDEAAAPSVAFLSPGRKTFRIVRKGALKSGAKVVLDGSYARDEKRFTVVNVIVTFPGEPDKAVGNVAITPAYFAKNGVSPDLTRELMKGIGKSSSNESSHNYQAHTELDGKAFDATTAIFTGPKVTSLTVRCTYSIQANGTTKPR